MKQVRLLQAAPVPMPLGDVLPSLQQGAIDGQMTTGSVLAPMHFFDVAKYMFATNHAITCVIVVISALWYDKLPPDLQKVVSEAGTEATRETTPWIFDFISRQREAWLKAGGEFTQPTAEENAQLMKMMQPIGAEVTAKKPEEKALYELLLRATKRTE